MKGISYIIIFTTLFTLSLHAQTAQETAKNILDNTAMAFRADGGIKADFIAKVFDKKQLSEETQGTIQLKGEKFLLKTNDVIVWFDGKTQWTYWIENDEVNVTTPTAEELQSTNPYALLSGYQKEFEYQKGTKTLFRGKPVNEILLTANAHNKDRMHIRLYITEKTYQLMYIETEQQNGNRSEITITEYQTKKTYDDALFRFNSKEYPEVEIIDLR
ncbi:MAG: outer-membrane lipoprotein carrier protein LolA [Mediterranea sp.]|jgi:outer membrane lipoprotein-sorting protein|nr:outer-membrane lipoprotein carrier protein LolA [Mediterranea sp.]